ncbi:MAG: hypothetical protein R3B93_11760 [Bacteroidia bacterium]
MLKIWESNPLPYVPYVISYPWEFASASLFDSDFIKLRDISLSYQFPRGAMEKISFLNDLQISVYSRNICFRTKKQALELTSSGIPAKKRLQETEEHSSNKVSKGTMLNPRVIPIDLN